MRELILASLLAAAGILAWWLQGNQDAAPSRANDGVRRPDYTVGGLVASMMDEQGRLHRRLTATEVRHYPDDGSSELDDPHLTVFEESAPPWVIRSNDGWMSEDGDELLLHGAVLIDREAGTDTRPVHVKTWELYVKPREDYAQTDRPVHITSNADWLSSTKGARIWFGEDLRAQFLGRTRAQVAIGEAAEPSPGNP